MDTLNAEQSAAVTHGTGDSAADTRPLLIIAGAGSGKTHTLAHRVAHLIRHGADPQRLLLLTFSRRAAQEMAQRAGAVLQRVLQLPPTQAPPGLPWAGTFHAIGARLLREYAPRLGLAQGFTLHDRGDAEDLMGLVRHETGLSQTHKRFPQKGTCLGIYSRVVNTPWRRCSRPPIPGARPGSASSRPCSAPTWTPSRRRTCWTTTTCCCSGPR